VSDFDDVLGIAFSDLEYLHRLVREDIKRPRNIYTGEIYLNRESVRAFLERLIGTFYDEDGADSD